MEITKEQIIKIAQLARLNLKNDEEIEFYKKELGKILGLIEHISKAPIDKNASDCAKLESSMREDGVVVTNTTSDIMLNSPKNKYNYFVVPKVIE